jgi:excisionase family DNA binding protein
LILADAIVATIGLKDQYFDLEGLSTYSALKVPTLREYIKKKKLPCFKIKGKILIRKSEFDSWLEKFRVKDRIDDIVNDVMSDLKRGKSKY